MEISKQQGFFGKDPLKFCQFFIFGFFAKVTSLRTGPPPFSAWPAKSKVLGSDAIWPHL